LITIDGVAYGQAGLSQAAKKQLSNVRFVEQKLAQLERQFGIADIEHVTYVNAVSAAFPKQPAAPKEYARGVVVDDVTHDRASLDEGMRGLIAGIRAADQELGLLHAKSQWPQVACLAFAHAVQQDLPKRNQV
jgi:hypothetical protein